MIDHHKLPMRLMANWFQGRTLRFVHDENVGIDKGKLVQEAVAQGVQVVGFIGDGKGDIEGARVTARLGGLVLARANRDLAAWCEKNLMPEQWKSYEDFHSVLGLYELQARIGGN
jgi:2-hydroxy-3-keto-5-methylthiopentenyl-1-phosphate phosphatase